MIMTMTVGVLRFCGGCNLLFKQAYRLPRRGTLQLFWEEIEELR